MLYQAKLSPKEESLLARCIGEDLAAVRGDRCSAELQTASGTVFVRPEEVATPDEEHQVADVDRISVEKTTATVYQRIPPLVIEELGPVDEINVISVLVSFSPPRPGGPIALPGGGVIPAGLDYGLFYYPPTIERRALRDLARSAAVVDVDVACEVLTANRPPIVLYTPVCGHFVHVSDSGLPESENWVRLKEFTRRRLRREA